MKQFTLLVLAAITGSAITVGTYRLVEKPEQKTFRIEHISETPAAKAVYTVNKNGEVVPLEFTKVAKKVMPAVVHIKSTHFQKVNQDLYRNYPDPFRQFFDDDMFEFFFGQPREYNNRPQQRG
ncbi:MAG: serine protease, partial [Phototrophicales bacterium]